MVKGRPDERAQAVVDELRQKAERCLETIAYKFSNKTEVERAKAAYEAYVEAIHSVSAVFNLNDNLLADLQNQQKVVVTGLKYDREYSYGPYFNVSNDARPMRVFVHSFSFYVGRQQHLAHYKWNGSRWVPGTMTKLYPSDRETRGSTISQHFRNGYWRFIEQQEDVRAKLDKSAQLLTNVQDISERIRVNGVSSVIDNPAIEEKVWTGSTYGFGLRFNIRDDDIVCAILFDEHFNEFEGFQVKKDSYLIDAEEIFKEFANEFRTFLENDPRTRFRVLAEQKKGQE